jgi:hypothetical protein
MFPRCENDILELEIELQSRDDAIDALNKKVANASRDSEDMKSEFVATRALVEQLTGTSSCVKKIDLLCSLMSFAGKLADQTAKNDDISVELLKLISEKKQVKFA